jgi:hypothetical protein
MKSEIYIQIPEPCHEDWDQMTTAQQGRFCQSCCKEVIDFSVMSDAEIIRFLSKPQGKTCGNFASDQLNRAISEPTTPAKQKLWAMIFSFLVTLFVSQKATAQRGKLSISSRQKETVKCETQLRGDTVATPVNEKFSIYGKVTDSSFNPVAFATVSVVGTHLYAVADSAGNYSINNIPGGDITLSVSSVGFHSKELKLLPKENAAVKDVLLAANVTKLPEVTVTSIPLISCQRTQNIVLQPEIKPLQEVVVGSSYVGRMAGGLSVCTTIRTTRTLRDTITAIFNPSAIKIFPNPATKDGHVFVQLSELSAYQLKLFNNQSQLILQRSFHIVSKKQSYQLELPADLASGIYFVNVVDTKSNKQYTQKLIIQ